MHPANFPPRPLPASALPSAPPDTDSATRSTDTDASHARLSAARLGYFVDPYAQLFVTRPQGVRDRPALINVGTWVRSWGVDALVRGFVHAAGAEKVQILSVGAGSDTRFWRLATGPLKDRIAKYVEVDFPEITSSKARAVYKHAALRGVVGECKLGDGGTALHSQVYHLLPTDLRLPPSSSLSALLSSSPPILSPHLPTLLLAECVFPYMSPSAGSALLNWAVETFGVCAVVLYEMFGLGDAFGAVMRENLAARGVHIPGALPSLDVLKQRFLDSGLDHAQALTLHDVRTACVPAEEAERVTRIEQLDEYEELDLVLRHYAIAWGSKGLNGAGWGLDAGVAEE